VGRRSCRCLRTRSLVFTMASARHRGALVVRARSRVSASAVHARGRRDRDALRSSSALRTNPTSRTSCLVCSQRGNPKRLSPPNFPRSEACASCPLSATLIRGPLSRRVDPISRAIRREGVHRKARGPPMRSEAGGTRVSRRADRRANRSRSRGECSSLHAFEATAPWVSLSPPSPRSRSGFHRTGSRTKAAEIESACALVKADRTPFRSETPSIVKSLTHPRTRRTTYASRTAFVEKPCGVFFWKRGRSRDEDRPSLDDTVRPFIAGAIEALSRFHPRRACARRVACD
jgi:hypothetical protein